MGLLDTQSQGESPHLLPNTVQPTVDITPHYKISTRDVLSVTLVGTMTGDAGYFGSLSSTGGTPDQGELWHVTSLGIRSSAVLAAGTTYRLAIGWRTGNNIAIITPPVSFTAGEAIGMGCTCDFWMTPGDQFITWVLDYVAGTAAACIWTAGVYRFKQ